MWHLGQEGPPTSWMKASCQYLWCLEGTLEAFMGLHGSAWAVLQSPALALCVLGQGRLLSTTGMEVGRWEGCTVLNQTAGMECTHSEGARQTGGWDLLGIKMW